MKRNYLLAAGAFVGFFSLGAMFAPIGNSSANGINSMDSKNMSVIQMVNEEGAPQQGQEEFTCPKTGGEMGNKVGMRNMAGMGMAGSMKEVISEALGITVDEYQEARQEGLSIADLAEQKGVKAEELGQLMIESRKIQLEQLVKEGKLTKEQMDIMLEKNKSMMERAIERDGNGPMQECGMGQKGRWNSDVNPSQTNIELEL
jgi:hypothetical protein